MPLIPQINIVVVGGNYAGAEFCSVFDRIAKSLKSKVRCILIDPKGGYLQHHIAAPRALVDDAIIPQTWIKLDVFKNLKDKGSYIKGSAINVLEKAVQLEDGTAVPYDYLIVATGSRTGAPSHLKEMDYTKGIQEQKKYYEQVKNAKRILIVGGGAAGVEAAGEIKSKYHDKKVTIVHSGKTLLSLNGNGPFKNRMQTSAKTKLERLGVEVVLHERVMVPRSHIDGSVSAQTVTLESESGYEAFESDLQLYFFGSRKYNSELLQSLEEVSLITQPNGEIETKSSLQINSDMYPNIFLIGDVAKIPGQLKLASHAKLQAAIAAKNIFRLINDRSAKLLEIKKSPVYCVMVLGHNIGFAELNGAVFGSFVATFIKGKDYLTGRFKKELGASTGGWFSQPSKSKVHDNTEED